MTTENTEAVTWFAFEGPLSLWQAITLGIVLVALFGWYLWRESQLSQKRVVLLFCLLRAITIATVIWMLLGPAQLSVQRQSRPKTVAILADASPSMQVVDPPNPARDVRWTLAHQAEPADQLTVACDRAIATTASAALHLSRALEQMESGQNADQFWSILDAARQSLERSATYVGTIRDGVNANQSELDNLADEVYSMIDDQIRPALDRLSSDSQSGSGILEPGAIGQMQALLPRVEQLQRRTRHLGNRVASQLETPIDSATRQQLRRDATLSRAEKVAQLLDASEASWLGELTNTVRVKRYRFDSVASPIASSHWGQALSAIDSNTSYGGNESRNADSRNLEDGSEPITDLSEALEQVGRDASDEAIEAVVLLTDGRHTNLKGRNPRDVAPGLSGFPVHVLPIGNVEALRDVILHHVDAPSAVLKRDTIVIDALVSTYQCADESLVVELVQNDEVIRTQEIDVPADRSDHNVSFALNGEEVGRYEYELRIDPLDDEADDDNNVQSIALEVIEDKIEVLLADNVPRWEFRYLANLFNRDKRLGFDQLLFGPHRAGSGRLRANAQFPKDVDAWSHYRVVILGDVMPQQLGRASQESLKQYISQRGGILILIAGRESMPGAFEDEPLGSLVPVERSEVYDEARDGFSLVMTAEGRLENALLVADSVVESDRVWREISRSLPVQFISEYSHPKRTARTLVRAVSRSAIESNQREDPGDERAFLCWHRVGRGRVVYLSSPSTYHLRFRSGDRFHHRFWGQLIRWSIGHELAGGSQTVRIRTDKRRYHEKEPVQVIARLSELNGQPIQGASLQARAIFDDRKIATVDLAEDENIPGRYLGRFEDLQPGHLAIEVAGNEVDELLTSEEFAGPIQTPVHVRETFSTEMIDTSCDLPLLEQIAELTGGQVISPTAFGEVLQLSALSPQVTENTTREPLWNQWRYLWLVFGCLVFEWAARKIVGLA